MRPFAALPPKVLASLLAVLLSVLLFAVCCPLAFLAVLGLAALLTLAGAASVAMQAQGRAGGCTPALPLPEVAVFFVAFLVLCLCAAPGMYFKDGGELAASAHCLGVAHPTGFPVFCMFGKGLSLAPFGGIFFRINVLSALATALAAAISYALARTFTANRWVPLFAPLGLLGGHSVWLHGTTTEVYALSLAGLAAALLAFVIAQQDARGLLLGWFLTGLGAAGHITWPMYAGLAGLFFTALALWSYRKRAGSLVLASLVMAALGALAVLYLPVAASRNPIMNWGDPGSLGAMWDHITGRRIRDSFSGQVLALRPGPLYAHLVVATRVAWEGSGPLWPLAVVGLVARPRGLALVLAAVAMADLAYSVAINPMGVSDLQTLQPFNLCVAVLGAAGVGLLARRPAVFVLLAACALGLQWFTSPAERDMRPVHGPREVAYEFLHAAPAGAVLFSSSDDLSAVVVGAQAVEGARPDVVALVKQHLADQKYVERKFRAAMAYPEDQTILREARLAPFEANGESPVAALGRAAKMFARRGQVYMEMGEGAVDQPLLRSARPGFPAFLLKPTGDDLLRLVREAVSRSLAHCPSSDRFGRDFLAGSIRLVATHLALSGREDVAIGLLAQALQVSRDDPRTLNNLGVLLDYFGMSEQALPLLQRAVEVAPDYERGWRTLARLARKLGLARVAEEAEATIEELSR